MNFIQIQFLTVELAEVEDTNEMLKITSILQNTVHAEGDVLIYLACVVG